ncbi:MAG: 60S ribosomal export protein NMD3 [Methanomassiliicoccales archaeon]
MYEFRVEVTVFCIRCGREALKGWVLCEECALNSPSGVTVPDKVDISICGSCGKVKEGKNWLNEDKDEFIKRAVLKQLHLPENITLLGSSLEVRDAQHSGMAELHLLIGMHGLEKEEKYALRLNIDGSSCPGCSKRSGHYYEAVIQVRGFQKEREEVLQNVLRHLEEISHKHEAKQGFFISSVKLERGGIDIQMSSNSIGAEVARELAVFYGVKMKATKKLYGRREGRELYRMTFLIRLPMFINGDYVEFKGVDYRVKRTEGGFTMESLYGRRVVNLPPEETAEIRYIGGPELERWLPVVRSDGGYAEVEVDGRRLRVAVNGDKKFPEGSQIRVVVLENRAYRI